MTNTPKLRFKEFNEPWICKKIGNITSLVKDGTHGTHQDVEKGPYLLSAKNIKDGKIVITDDDRKISEEEYNTIYKNYSLEVGDILLSIVGTIGRVAIVKEVKDIAFQRSVAILRFNRINSKFIECCMNNRVFQNDLLKYQVISAQPGIYLNDLKKLKVNFPSLKEQEKIASFFSLIDKKVELQTEKVEELKKYKKGIMQKIFSGELRFKDDNGNEFPEWEEKMLGECLISRVQKQVPSKDAPLMAFTSKGGIESKGERYDRSFLVKDDAKKYKRTELNDFIYSSNNLDVGSMGLNKYGTAVISDVYEIFQIKNNVLPDIINSILHKPDVLHKVLKYRQGALYGQYRIHADDFLKVNVKIPCYREQEKIALFLELVDKTIDLHTKKLDLLTDYKKGLLQQMFI